MAHVLENTKVVYGLRWAFNFIFGFKKIGPSCNAHRPKLFTYAECETHPVFCGEGQGGVSVGFVNLFETGFRIISQLKCGNMNYSDLEGHYKNAFDILDKFVDTRSSHENSLNKLLKLKNGGKLTQADVTTALAEHLLSKLTPGQTYTIDKRQRDKSCNIICKCGCGATLKFGYTGIGHEEVWHGFIDIMLFSHEGMEPETAIVIVPDDYLDPVVKMKEPDTEPVAKKSKQEPDKDDIDISSDDSEILDSDEIDNSPYGESSTKIEIDSEDIVDIDDQTIAQAIVFSKVQKISYPEYKNLLIPTIVMSSTKFRIIMYDAENDLLLQSNTYNLFHSSELSIGSIIILWMVLHYRTFCSGMKSIDLYQDLNIVKSGFKDKLEELECKDIYNSKLKSCVASFPKIERRTMDTRGLNPLCGQPRERLELLNMN